MILFSINLSNNTTNVKLGAQGGTVEMGMYYGKVTASLVGVAMKEAVRRAASKIREQRFIFNSEAKLGKSGQMDDLVTSADRAAQEIYLRVLRESFPLFGIVAEEDNLSIPCKMKGRNAFFTVDPLDGTKAFGRGQSHGVGTMISLVYDGKVIAAFVGDVMVNEVYGFRPDSSKVHRITELDQVQQLEINQSLPLHRQYALLRGRVESHGPLIEQLIVSRRAGGVFRDIEIMGGSIGTGMARLWKGEVGAVALAPNSATPWDSCPVFGISEKMGFVFLRPTKGGDMLEKFEFTPSPKVEHWSHETLIIHQSRLHEISALLA